MKKVNDTRYRIIALVLALAMMLTTVLPANVSAQAAENGGADTAAVATPGDADGIYQDDDGYFYYYVGGEKVAKTGWVEVGEDMKLTVKLDSNYRVQYKITNNNGADHVSKFDADKKDFADLKNDVIELKDKKLHYAGADGVIETHAGNKNDGMGTTYVLGNGGIVTAKFVKSGEVRKYYTYTSGKWNQLKGAYKTFDGVLYYFSANSGTASLMYDNSTEKLYKYVSAKMTLVKSNVSTVGSNKIFYFGSNGKRVTKAGWYKLASGTKVYVGSKGYVTAKMTVSGKSTKYYTYDYSSLKWVSKKSTWINASGIDYYYAGNGVAAYAYNTSTGKFIVYKGGKWNAVKNAVYTLKNGKMYLVGSKSVVVKTAGWYALNSSDKVYVGSKGYVTMKFSAKTGKLAKYNYTTKKWELVKVSTYKIGTKNYYFVSNGVAVYARDMKTDKVTVRKGGSWTAVKNAICKLDGGKIYLVNSKSVLVKKAGWYSINSAEKICVGSKGYVTMKFSTKTGKLTKYNYTTKKWELIKVVSYKIGSKTYYFDSKGIVAKNKIVGNDKTGYFYVDETGSKATSTEIQMAVDFVRVHTDDSMTNEQKLYACFVYLSRNYPYLRDYVVPTDASRFTYYCIDMLTNNHGNCYRCAATFATVATVLGYKARVTCGQVTNLQGDGFTIHGWTELWRPEDNEWVVYDVSMQRNWPARDYYHVLMRDYYPTHRIIGPRARLTVNNGKANWRWLADSELGDH